jgi:Fic family protein
MAVFIHQLRNWPQFYWQPEKLANLLSAVRLRQGRLAGQMEAMGRTLQQEAMLQTLTLEVVKSAEIDGEVLQPCEVRAAIARRLGLDPPLAQPGLAMSEKEVEGMVDLVIDASRAFDTPLTADRLFGWHWDLFPLARNETHGMVTGNWRNNAPNDPMQVVSGHLGRQTVHFEAPASELINDEMDQFLGWFNSDSGQDPVLKAAIAHLYFVTIHPFDDGNGRIARAITEMQLSRADGSAQRFYSMSAQMRAERNRYYAILEETQKGDLDITAWLEWFLGCLDRALAATGNQLAGILQKARFREINALVALNDRQRLLINKLQDGFEGKLTTSKWATIAKCSQDTALRDIQELMRHGILSKEKAGGRSTHYLLKSE